MGSLIIIGRVFHVSLQSAAASYLEDLNHATGTLPQQWIEGPDEIDSIDPLNLASIVAFTDHAAQIEGLANTDDALQRSRWKHLPRLLESWWLPIEADRTKIAQVEGSSFPVFFGSSFGLLADLADLRGRSPHLLGTIPPYYELMRTEQQQFYSLDLPAFDETTTLQWVWHALHDAATVSVKENMPMFGIA